jgi:arsenate reductase (glutaredoxin)
MKIYHHPRCSKSRSALSILLKSTSDIQVVEYMKNTPNEDELRNLLKKLNMKPEEIVRKGEVLYTEKYKGKYLSDDEWISILAEHPILIERPIVIKGDKAIIARPPERVNEFL